MAFPEKLRTSVLPSFAAAEQRQREKGSGGGRTAATGRRAVAATNGKEQRAKSKGTEGTEGTEGIKGFVMSA